MENNKYSEKELEKDVLNTTKEIVEEKNNNIHKLILELRKLDDNELLNGYKKFFSNYLNEKLASLEKEYDKINSFKEEVSEIKFGEQSLPVINYSKENKNLTDEDKIRLELISKEIEKLKEEIKLERLRAEEKFLNEQKENQTKSFRDLMDVVSDYDNSIDDLFRDFFVCELCDRLFKGVNERHYYYDKVESSFFGSFNDKMVDDIFLLMRSEIILDNILRVKNSEKELIGSFNDFEQGNDVTMHDIKPLSLNEWLKKAKVKELKSPKDILIELSKRKRINIHERMEEKMCGFENNILNLIRGVLETYFKENWFKTQVPGGEFKERSIEQMKKNPGSKDALEFFDLMSCKQIMIRKDNWEFFSKVFLVPIIGFNTKGGFEEAFDKITVYVRNPLKHERTLYLVNFENIKELEVYIDKINKCIEVWRENHILNKGI